MQVFEVPATLMLAFVARTVTLVMLVLISWDFWQVHDGPVLRRMRDVFFLVAALIFWVWLVTIEQMTGLRIYLLEYGNVYTTVIHVLLSTALVRFWLSVRRR